MSFIQLTPTELLASSDSIVSPCWSTNETMLTTFESSSSQIASSAGNYYLSVYQTSSIFSYAEVQFDLTYGNKFGSGSTWYNNAVPENSPTKTIYGQYRALILEDENSSFTFGVGNNTYKTDDFWVINFERARYKQSLFPGSLNLSLSGSGGLINLTDDSMDNRLNQFLGSTRVYQLISGSNGTAGSNSTSGYVVGSGSYGLVFPDLGTILINPAAISQSINLFPSHSNNSEGLNNEKLFTAIKLGSNFQIQSQETLSSDFIFCRVGNSLCNYSENPSFISGSTGEIIYPQFINSPQVYITAIGLYNNSNELLAVAKLSRPLVKDFTKEALFRVKLDF